MNATLKCLVWGSVLSVCTGCDNAPKQARHYDTVARIDLQAVRASDWAKALLKDGKMPKLVEGCRDLLLRADAVTVGMGKGTTELYVEGATSASAMTTCVAHLTKEQASTNEDGTKHAVKHEALADDLHAIVVGPEPLPTTTRARHQALLDADPGLGQRGIWLTARNAGKTSALSDIEMGLSTKDGLDGHVGLKFVEGTDAAAFAAQATVFLTAMRFSEETADVAKAVDLGVKGKTISIKVHATEAMVEAAIEAAGKDRPKASLRDEEIRKRMEEGHDFGFSFSFG